MIESNTCVQEQKCKSTCFCDTQRPQWKLSFQFTVSFNTPIKKQTWKSEQATCGKNRLNQWCNTDAVLKWFKNTTDKSKCSFIQFDIKEFYPSITENILQQTFKFAKQHTNIDKNDLHIINHYRKSLHFSDNKNWNKKTTESCFDVTTGSFDGAEIYELVGL